MPSRPHSTTTNVRIRICLRRRLRRRPARRSGLRRRRSEAVREGKNVAVENYWKEVFDGGGIAGTSRQPRTAIGATADGKLILLVCDGRNMRGSAGFTLAELADKLIALGAVDAVNLDGGGSSTMVGSDGKVLNRPSDTGNAEVIVERKISTAVVISEVN